MSTSALAQPAEKFGFRTHPGHGPRGAPLFGITMHTTGSGVPRKASGVVGTIKEALRHYTANGSAHYVIGWDGTIARAIADEARYGNHAGLAGDSDAGRKYAGGGWEGRVSQAGARMWHERWAPTGRKTPDQLLPPGRTRPHVNKVWLGIEMIPVTDGKTFWAKPMREGLRFTKEQHDAARALINDIASRHNFPAGWNSKGSPRLIGHSDIHPIGRDNASLPLWDPGYPYAFDMDYIRGGIGDFLIKVGLAAGVGYLLYRYVFK